MLTFFLNIDYLRFSQGGNSGANKPGIASNSFSSGSPAGRPTIGGSNNMGFNNNAGFNMNNMNQRGGSSLNAVKSETQGLTETVRHYFDTLHFSFSFHF